MNNKLLEKVSSKINTPSKVFRQGTRTNLRSSKMSTTSIVETSETSEVDKLTEAGKVDDNIDKDKNVISEDIAFQIIKRKESEFILRGILPLSQKLKDELLHGIQLSADQGRALATMAKLFNSLKVGDKDEYILYFMGEYIHEDHLFGQQIRAIENNMDKINAKRFEEQIELWGDTITHTVMYHLKYKNIFKIQKDKLAVLILSLNESPLKHIAKDTAIPLIIIGIYHMANYLDKDLIDNLDNFTEIFQTIIDLISTNLKMPHLQICQFLEDFDFKESLECFKNNDFYKKK